jgi:general secretion pathway protein K
VNLLQEQRKVNNKGIALVLVLLVILLLMVIVLEFSFAMKVEITATQNSKDETDCYFYAQSGFQQAVAEIIKGCVFLDEEETTGEVSPWRDDQRKIEMEFGHGKAEVIISGESGKYDINTIPEDLLRNLIATLGIEERARDIIVDSIMDWKDIDNLQRINGAEDDYYESLSHPYHCKDGPFDTVEELLLVRGITPSLLYGSFVTENGKKKPFGQKGLVDLVTVYTRSFEVDANTAPREVLMSIPSMTEGGADWIIETREEKPLKDLTTLRQQVGDQAFTRIFFKYLDIYPSMIYTIISTGSIPDSEVLRRVKGVVKINLTDKEKFQVLYWVDNYPIAENLIFPEVSFPGKEEGQTS